MDEKRFECIVIGAGVEGSATAYNLAKNGVNTLLLEQFTLPHTRGSSTGQTRITRHAYPEHFYAEMMLEAFPEWADIEKQTNSTIYTNCGLIVFEKRPLTTLTAIESNLKKNNIPHHWIDQISLESKYKIKYDDSYGAFYDVTGGTLKANKALTCLQELFKRYGGKISDAVKVLKIHPGPVITLTTSAGQMTARHLVVCAGPWTSKLLQPLGLYLPLKALCIQIYYCKEKQLGIYSSGNGFPCIIDYSGPTGQFYSTPADEYPGFMKIGFHGGNEADPDSRDKVDNPLRSEFISEYVQRHFPFLEREISIRETCMYTNTPDEVCILDRHPNYSNIVIGAGFSGTGFKLAPVVGKILTNMVLNRRQIYDLSPFAIARFKNTQQKSSL